MKDYLTGYLDVLPDYQRKRIQDIIQENQELFNISSLNEKEFAQLIAQLTEQHQQLTIFIPQMDKLDEELHNTFYSNVHVDLNMMFAETQLIESATMNYDRIFDGIIADLEKEVQSLRNRISTLKLVSEGEDGLIVKSYSFDDQSQMEMDKTKYAHLFKDRDGSNIPDIVMEGNKGENFIVLGKTNEIDCLHDEKGMTTATIKIIGRRGTPIQLTDNSKYKLENAIDSSVDSYWGEVVLVDEPIQQEMEK